MQVITKNSSNTLVFYNYLLGYPQLAAGAFLDIKKEQSDFSKQVPILQGALSSTEISYFTFTEVPPPDLPFFALVNLELGTYIIDVYNGTIDPSNYLGSEKAIVVPMEFSATTA